MTDGTIDPNDNEWAELGKRGFGGGYTKNDFFGQFEKFEERPAEGQGKKSIQKGLIKKEDVKTQRSQVEVGLKWKYHTYSSPAFQYLLSKSFDLFGYIDAGLALDRETLKK